MIDRRASGCFRRRIGSDAVAALVLTTVADADTPAFSDQTRSALIDVVTSGDPTDRLSVSNGDGEAR